MPAQAVMIYVADIEESEWQVKSSPVRCELRHAIPRYGEGRFVYSAGGELAFEVSVFDPPVRDSAASMTSIPPFWKPGTPKELGQLALSRGKIPFYVGRNLAQRMLYELDAGMLPTLQYKDWADQQDDVFVSLSSARFHDKLPEFQQCIGQLLPYGAADLKDVIVEFGENKYSLDEDARQRLDTLALYAHHDKKLRIDLRGHTDDVGSKTYNKILSQRRVHAVEKHLLARGVSPGQIRRQSFGEDHPSASNQTEEGRRMNRRVMV
ncbi:MAG: sodium-type flagellar protein MotY, partial [Pseudomonadota bacterium]|nr:sodium-type flagellar protein MotY [Pseudomonadota bacterium]